MVRATNALGEGRAWIAKAVLERSLEHCGATTDAALSARVEEALRGPASAPPENSYALLQQATTAARDGKAVEARRLRSRAIARFHEEGARPITVRPNIPSDQKLVMASTDGSRMLFASPITARQSPATVVSTETLRAEWFLEDIFPQATSLAMSPDGLLIAQERGGQLLLLSRGAEPRRVELSKPYVDAVAFFPNGKELLATSHVVGEQPVWEAVDVVSLKARRLRGPPSLDRLQALTVAASGKLAAFAFRDSVEVWDLVSGKRTGELSFENPHALGFSPSGRRLYVKNLGSTAIWDGRSKTAGQTVSIGRYGLLGDNAVFSADEQTLLTVGHGRLVSIDVLSGKATDVSAPVPQRAGMNWVESGLALADGRAAISGPRSVNVLSSAGASAREVVTVGAAVRRVVAGANGSLVCSFLEHEGLQVIDGARARFLDLPTGSSEHLLFAISPDGARVATNLAGGVAFVDVETAERRKAPAAPGVVVSALAFDEKAQLLAAVVREGKLALARLDGDEWQSLALTPAPSVRSNPMFSGDGRLLFAPDSGAWLTFNAATGQSLGKAMSRMCSDAATSFDGASVLFPCAGALQLLHRDAAGAVAGVDLGGIHGLPQFGAQTFYAGVALTREPMLALDPQERGGVAVIDIASKKRAGTLFAWPGRNAALLVASDARYQVIGSDGALLRNELVCQVGTNPEPLETCEGLEDAGLFGELFGTVARPLQ